MAFPTATLTYDKASYVPGEFILATITYSDPDSQTFTGTGTVTDSQGNPFSVSGMFSVSDILTNSMSDNGGRTWTKLSDDGAVAVWRAVA